MPENAGAPLRVYADRLVMDAGAGSGADVRALSNLALIQVSRAEIDRRDGAPVYAPGLVVHAIDDAPRIAGSQLGREFVTIVHSDGVAVSPARNSVAGLSDLLR
jgi:hypothetical protein